MSVWCVCAVRACIKQFNRSRMCFILLSFASLIFFFFLFTHITCESVFIILFLGEIKKSTHRTIIDKSLDHKYLNPITFTAFFTPFTVVWPPSRSHIIWIPIKTVREWQLYIDGERCLVFLATIWYVLSTDMAYIADVWFARCWRFSGMHRKSTTAIFK